MKRLKIMLLAGSAMLAFASAGFAGTVVFKDGSSISDAEIVSINDGAIIIQKDNKKKRYPLDSIASYSKTNTSATGEQTEDLAPYKVSIIDIKVPKTGEDKEGNTEEFVISYSISKEKSESKRIKVPYFYLYVLISGDNETDERKILRFLWPDKAKPKGGGYDVPAIMERVQAFDRMTWGDDEDTPSLDNKITGREVSFPLKKVGKRHILAYHLEIWGNTEKIAEKSEVMTQVNLNLSGNLKVGKNWWERY